MPPTGRFLLLAIFVATLCPLIGSGENKELPKAPIPTRYQEIVAGKLARLVAVWGAPEVDPTNAHTAAFSRDGKRAIFASDGSGDQVADALISVWDVDQGRLLAEWRVPKAAVTALALTPDGRQVLLGLVEPVKDKPEKTMVSLRDAVSGKQIRSWSAPAMACLAISADGKQALGGGADGAVKHWDLDTGKEMTKLPGHNKNFVVACVAFIPKSALALSSSADNKIKIWDLKTAKEIRSLEHAPGAFALAVTPDGSRLASLTFDHTIKIWNLKAGKELRHLKKDPPSNGLGTVSLSPDGKRVLAMLSGLDPTGTREESSATLWDAKTGKPLWSVKTNFKGMVPIHYESGVLGGGANLFTRWDLDKGKQLAAWGGHKGTVSGLGAARLGNLVYSAGQDGQILRWGEAGPKHLAGHGDAINALAVSATGMHVLSAGADKKVKFWEFGLADKEPLTFTGHTGNVTSVALAPSGTFAISASADRTLKTWNLKTGKEIATFTGHGDAVNAVAVSPDGKWLASAGDDNHVRLWPVKAGKPAGDSVLLEGHKRQVQTVAFSPDGKHVLSGSQDKTLKLWDVAEGACVKTLEGHKNWVHAVAFRNNHQAVSASDDLTLRFWDLKTGKETDQIDLGKSTDVARSLAFAGENTLLVGTAGWVILRFEITKKE